MNLHGIVRGAVGAINPTIIVSIQRSTGYTTSADGTRVPAYDPPVEVRAQRQSLTYTDLTQLDGLNIQGERCALYLDGDWAGVVRADGRGGDLLTMPNGTQWLAALVLENWQEVDGWVKVAFTRQMNT